MLETDLPAPRLDPPVSENQAAPPASAPPVSAPSGQAPSATEVYAIHGADPEVLAYAMAKYSRSSLTMRESLAEISAGRAEQFLNTFYFQYGHRSIADLAHIPFAIERLSLLAAIELVDEGRWDGQERSTRYQNFEKSGWFTPDLGPATETYTAAIESLFTAYRHTGAKMFEALQASLSRPEAMKPDAYERTLKARAFDVARYLLPLATNTSLGEIVNARTLENQISRLLSSPFAEIRSLGEQLRHSAAEPAWNVNHAGSRTLIARARETDPDLARDLEAHLLREVKTAPTLVKYASPNPYLLETTRDLTSAAAALLQGIPIDPTPTVDLLDDTEPLEVELATSLLYPHSHHPYRQLRNHIAALTSAQIDELIQLGTRHRGRHDELLRPFSAGAAFRFDILMDIGGFRDMHRHRRCIQLLQPYTDLHGYDDPLCPGQPTLAEAGIEEDFRSAIAAAYITFRTLSKGDTAGLPPSPLSPADSSPLTAHSSFAETTHPQPERPGGLTRQSITGNTGAYYSAQYLLPLATRRRAMFKMDFAEALYIAELRSGPAGHFSYRRIAWEMFRAIEARHPSLAKLFRIEDVNQPIDLLRR